MIRLKFYREMIKPSTYIAQKMHCCEIVWFRTLEHFKILAIPAIIETSGVNCMQNFKTHSSRFNWNLLFKNDQK
jgi:hypothetical protein